MIGDSSRGYLLELLLTKVLYLNSKKECEIQIVGMSATIPNLDAIAKWLNAELYITSFRPIPLYERVIFGDIIYDLPQLTEFKRLNTSELGINSDDSNTIYLAIDTMTKGMGALIFCATKAMCEITCRNIATNVYEFGRGKKPQNSQTKEIVDKLLPALNFGKIKELIEQLRRCPAGLDPIIDTTVKFGVAFHHAGLSIDERAIIEQAFRKGVIKILCATSTLSAGVNLPARLVIIKSPLDFKGSVMDVLTYKQMIGRAGRQGIDTMGESILICPEKDQSKAHELLKSNLKPIASCLVKTLSSGQSSSSTNSNISLTGLKRAILEIIANGTANSYEDVAQYIACTFLASMSSEVVTKPIIDEIIDYLVEYKLIHSLTNTESQEKKISPTQLGKAVLASGISPEEGLFIMDELNKANKRMCLSNDLHLLYEVTPTYLSEQMETIDWKHFLDIWIKLDEDMKEVGKLVGIREHFIISQISGVRVFNAEGRKLLSIHRRFYTALALNDLIQEEPLFEVSKKFKCSKGILQTLQQSASSFAGMITVFCAKLGWRHLEVLFEQFQSRLYFGVQRELIDLMRITCLNANVARLLFNHKYDTVVSLANAVNKKAEIELILMNSGPFDMNKESDASVMWAPGISKAMNPKEMTNSIILEAQEIIQKDLGIKITNFGMSQTSSLESTQTSIDCQKFSQEVVVQIPLNSNEFIHVKDHNKENNEEECVEEMSFIEGSVMNCDTSSITNQNKPYISSPMIVSPMISIDKIDVDCNIFTKIFR
jgi:DNA polymerase theta